ncbi:MAG TPA: GspH/FimT family pseudopilin [Allosphingosinicella sp.]|jgi:general secretion pathway protein H
MPTSATEPPARRARRRRRSEGGFTLVELLIVITIMGLLSAAVLLAAPASGPSLADEAERLAARARAAQEQAILGGRTMALQVTEAGYAFSVRSEGEWRPASSPAAGTWEAGTRVQGARMLFDAAGLSEPATLVLERGGERVEIGFTSEGEVDVRRRS